MILSSSLFLTHSFVLLIPQIQQHMFMILWRHLYSFKLTKLSCPNYCTQTLIFIWMKLNPIFSEAPTQLWLFNICIFTKSSSNMWNIRHNHMFIINITLYSLTSLLICHHVSWMSSVISQICKKCHIISDRTWRHLLDQRLHSQSDDEATF